MSSVSSPFHKKYAKVAIPIAIVVLIFIVVWAVRFFMPSPPSEVDFVNPEPGSPTYLQPWPISTFPYRSSEPPRNVTLSYPKGSYSINDTIPLTVETTPVDGSLKMRLIIASHSNLDLTIGQTPNTFRLTTALGHQEGFVSPVRENPESFVPELLNPPSGFKADNISEDSFNFEADVSSGYPIVIGIEPQMRYPYSPGGALFMAVELSGDGWSKTYTVDPIVYDNGGPPESAIVVPANTDAGKISNVTGEVVVKGCGKSLMETCEILIPFQKGSFPPVKMGLNMSYDYPELTPPDSEENPEEFKEFKKFLDGENEALYNLPVKAYVNNEEVLLDVKKSQLGKSVVFTQYVDLSAGATVKFVVGDSKTAKELNILPYYVTPSATQDTYLNMVIQTTLGYVDDVYSRLTTLN